MSIRRIESAYATYFDDKRISGKEMAVLIALAYVANEKKGELCFPSGRYLEKLTHFTGGAIGSAAKKLRDLGIIDWESGGKGRGGGNVANRYRFLFPHMKMVSRRERYQPLGETPTASAAAGPAPAAAPTSPGAVPTPPHGVPTPPHEVPYPTTWGTLAYQMTTNTEGTSNRTSESKSELSVVSSSGVFEGLFGSGFSVAPKKSGRQYPVVVQMALKACGVDDEYNANTFRKLIRGLDQDSVYEEILAFESQCRMHEHDGAESLPKVLMKRLQTRCRPAASK